MKRKMPSVKRHQLDLTRTVGTERSVGAKIETLVSNCNKYELDELKKRLTEILDDPDTYISKEKAAEYKNYMNRIYYKKDMMLFIGNIYLAAANLSTK
jgi:hypothetical protein